MDRRSFLKAIGMIVTLPLVGKVVDIELPGEIEVPEGTEEEQKPVDVPGTGDNPYSCAKWLNDKPYQDMDFGVYSQSQED